jgi:Aspartyl/Asparaginyl beta-hydroxylase
MSNFIKSTNDPLTVFIKENYKELRHEFFEHWFPNIKRRKLMFTWDNGKVPYANEINSAALKLSDRLLDSKEREEMEKILPNAPHMYPVRDVKPEVWKNLHTWRLLLEKFDSNLEALFTNIAYPGSKIFAHRGVDNHCYRMHLCLQNNLGFTFNIGGERQQWEEGPDHMFRFDDGNITHGVEYQEAGDTTPRVVMIFDVWKGFYD